MSMRNRSGAASTARPVILPSPSQPAASSAGGSSGWAVQGDPGVAPQIGRPPGARHHAEPDLAVVGEIDLGAADPRRAVQPDRRHRGVLAYRRRCAPPRPASSGAARGIPPRTVMAAGLRPGRPTRDTGPTSGTWPRAGAARRRIPPTVSGGTQVAGQRRRASTIHSRPGRSGASTNAAPSQAGGTERGAQLQRGCVAHRGVADDRLAAPRRRTCSGSPPAATGPPSSPPTSRRARHPGTAALRTVAAGVIPLPRPGLRVPRLEGEQAARPQRRATARVACARSSSSSRNIAKFAVIVTRSRSCRPPSAAGVALDPLHGAGTRLRASHVERRVRRVDREHLECRVPRVAARACRCHTRCPRPAALPRRNAGTAPDRCDPGRAGRTPRPAADAGTPRPRRHPSARDAPRGS